MLELALLFGLCLVFIALLLRYLRRNKGLKLIIKTDTMLVEAGRPILGVIKVEPAKAIEIRSLELTLECYQRDENDFFKSLSSLYSKQQQITSRTKLTKYANNNFAFNILAPSDSHEVFRNISKQNITTGWKLVAVLDDNLKSIRAEHYFAGFSYNFGEFTDP